MQNSAVRRWDAGSGGLGEAEWDEYNTEDEKSDGDGGRDGVVGSRGEGVVGYNTAKVTRESQVQLPGSAKRRHCERRVE